MKVIYKFKLSRWQWFKIYTKAYCFAIAEVLAGLLKKDNEKGNNI